MAGNQKKGSGPREPAPKKFRAFVAIELPEDLIDALARLQGGIREYGFAASWTRPENIHLTLKFLGDVAATEIEALGDKMASVASQIPSMSLTAQGLGVFPGVRRPRVLWTGVGGDTDRLGRLQRELEAGFEALGYARENKRFAGHFTLARFKGRTDPDAIVSAMGQFGGFVSDPFAVDRVHLFESRLTPRGPIYTKRVSHRLTGFDENSG